jgi:hypothetical protein
LKIDGRESLSWDSRFSKEFDVAKKQQTEVASPVAEKQQTPEVQEATWQEILADAGKLLDEVMVKVGPMFGQKDKTGKPVTPRHERCGILADYAKAAKQQVNMILKKE